MKRELYANFTDGSSYHQATSEDPAELDRLAWTLLANPRVESVKVAPAPTRTGGYRK